MSPTSLDSRPSIPLGPRSDAIRIVQNTLHLCSACLDGGREEHLRGICIESKGKPKYPLALAYLPPIDTDDTSAGTERVSGHVGRELGLDDTRVTVRPRDTSPHYADLGSSDLPLGLVNVSDSLGSSKGTSQYGVWQWCEQAQMEGKKGKREQVTTSERGFVTGFGWVAYSALIVELNSLAG
jgi:hypothetical protein